MGGCSVMLRMPAPAVPADAAEQLGLATPAFQDLPLAPVVMRASRAESTATKHELLVSASAIEALVGSLAYASASVLFANAFGVFENDTLHEIVSASAEEANGEPYIYRLFLRAPQARIT
jgi:hypothetical protein